MKRKSPKVKESSALFVAGKPAKGSMKRSDIVVIDPDIMSGTPCFAGTRVPVRNLLDCIGGGDSLDFFLRQFPSVTRQQAVEFLEQSSRELLAAAGAKSAQAGAVLVVELPV